MPLTFSKSTDTKHKVTLNPSLIYAEWKAQSAPISQKAGFAVVTSFVGQGAPVECKGKSAKGKSLGTVSGKMRGNRFDGEFTIPADTQVGDMVFFEVNLAGNGLTDVSNRIAAVPPIKVTDMHWSVPEARRGDIVTLSAKVENVPDEAPVKVIIFEQDEDGAHDKIVEIPAIVKNKKVELQWEYEYHEDTDEIPTDQQMSRYGRSYNPPEYFFVIRIVDQNFGKQQESGLLLFKDYIEIELKDDRGNIIENKDYVLHLPDGSERRGRVDANGRSRENDIPPGTVTIDVEGMEQIRVLYSE
jgi:hypothetical protein